MIKYVKVKCCICGEEMRIPDYPEIDKKRVICSIHKGDEIDDEISK